MNPSVIATQDFLINAIFVLVRSAALAHHPSQTPLGFFQSAENQAEIRAIFREGLLNMSLLGHSDTTRKFARTKFNGKSY